LGVMTILEIDNIDVIDGVGEALVKGGITVAEVVFRTHNAEHAVNLLGKKFPEMIVGAGTIINVEQAAQAVGAGAKFLVAPGFSESVVRWAASKSVPIIPGVSTSSEITGCIDLGLEVIKFFPVEAMGGVKILKALAGPFKNVRFVPTGGISEKNLADYSRLPCVFACGGSWIANKALIKARNFEEITRRAETALKIVRETRKIVV